MSFHSAFSIAVIVYLEPEFFPIYWFNCPNSNRVFFNVNFGQICVLSDTDLELTEIENAMSAALKEGVFLNGQLAQNESTGITNGYVTIGLMFSLFAQEWKDIYFIMYSNMITEAD